MTREIRFRAWDYKGKEMYQVKDLGIGEASWEKTATNYNEQPDTGYSKFYPSVVEIMQFTGLHDKNGEPIYEGDVVKGLHKLMPTAEVTEHTGVFGVVMADSRHYPLRDFTNIEIIGNKFTHPHLLDKSLQ